MLSEITETTKSCGRIDTWLTLESEDKTSPSEEGQARMKARRHEENVSKLKYFLFHLAIEQRAGGRIEGHF